MLRVLAFIALAPLALIARDVHACSCVPPAPRFVTVSGPLPSDAVGVVLGKGENPNATKLVVTAERLDVAKPVKVELVNLSDDLVLAKVKGGWAAGQRYRFTHSGKSIEVSIDAIAIGPLLKDATLLAPGHSRMPLTLAAGASCSDNFDTDQVPLRLKLPDAVMPYRDALLFTTTVDGQPWRPRASLCAWGSEGRSWLAPGTDLVFAKCGGRNAATSVASEGKHVVRMDATMPGTSFKTSASVEVSLSCQ